MSTLRRIGRLLGLGAGLMCGALAACTTGERPLRLGTTFTVEQSGELALWNAAGVRPPAAGGWYLQAGADQATTLHVADERNAYALADLPTLAKLGGLRLRVLFAADTALTNPYTLYVVRESPRRAAAQPFARWAMDSARPRILGLHLPDGTQAFVARTGGCTDQL